MPTATSVPGVMPSTPLHASAHEHHSRLILGAFEADHSVSQRSLAKDLGIALGLTNLLVKRLVVKGLVRVIQIKPNRVRYLITPAGIAEKTRMSRAYFDRSVQFSWADGDRIRQQFSASRPIGRTIGRRPSAWCSTAPASRGISYICLIETDLHLVGVVDAADQTLLRLRRLPAELLDELALNGQLFDRLVIVSFDWRTAKFAGPTFSLWSPLDRVFWL